MAKDSNKKKFMQELFRQEGEALGAFEVRKRQLPVEEIARETQKLQARIKEDQVPIRKQRQVVWYYRTAAAVILFLLVCGVYSMYYSGEEIIYQTAYGKIQTVTLPDKSTVTLNANSRLTYSANWERQSSREVWLKGEAFFHVRKKSSKEGGVKFVVHTDRLDVEVLGTQFNVRDRRDVTEVMLNSGKVKLKLKGSEKVMMKPGELVTYKGKTDYSLKQVDENQYTSWRNHILTFEDRTLGEIAMVLEETYGFKVVFKDPRIARERFTTTLSSDHIDILFPMLEEAFQLEITQQQDKIIMEY